MNDLEDRLRRELKRLSERAQPDSIRPLRLRGTARRRRAIRWLAPGTAMAAVLAVVAVVSVAGHNAAQLAAPQPASAGTPPYYVTVSDRAIGTKTSRVAVTVRSSATGRVLASLSFPPAQHGLLWISGSRDDRTFVISDGQGLGRYLLLRLSAAGRIARLSHLPTRFFAFQSQPGEFLTSLGGALSPDGRDLAFATNGCVHTICQFGIRVVSLATGASRNWTESINHQKYKGSGLTLTPSWAGNGQEIVFGQEAPGDPELAAYWLLNVAGGGGSLLANSRLILHAPSVQSAAQLTPDGRALILTYYRNVNFRGQDLRGVAVFRIVERSVLTGRVLRVLHVAKAPYDNASSHGQLAGQADGDCGVLSVGPTGQHVLVQCAGLGRLNGSKFTPLPGIPPGNGYPISFFQFAGVGGTAAW